MSHKTHIEIANELGALVTEKNKSYGDAYAKLGDVLKLMYPNGVTEQQLADLPMVLRCLEKLFRIANIKNAFGESPWLDVAGVAICGAKIDEGKEKAK